MKFIEELNETSSIKLNIMVIMWIETRRKCYNEKFNLKYNVLLNVFVLRFSVISSGLSEPKPT
jgi:hypothetical protein